ncbi:hypothetical protein G3N57_04955 [Paraburkholderia sp. Se-20369]|nr:hypothetical protein [Paraburkholderia sp. Se-20369]
MPDVLKYRERAGATAVHAGQVAFVFRRRCAAHDAARTTFGRGRLAAPFTHNWSQS